MAGGGKWRHGVMWVSNVAFNLEDWTVCVLIDRSVYFLAEPEINKLNYL